MDSHMAFTAALRTALDEDRITVDPAPATYAGNRAMQQIIAERMDVFGQAVGARTFAVARSSHRLGISVCTA